MNALVLLLLCASALVAQPFQAGAARRDITPREPVPMWGYADRHDALSQGVQDPLYADALVLDAAGRKLAIVGLDLGRAPAEPSLQRIRARILKETGIEHSLIGGSHTHHGPVLELSDAEGRGKGRFDATLRYYAQMEAAIAEARRVHDARVAEREILHQDATRKAKTREDLDKANAELVRDRERLATDRDRKITEIRGRR
jgi:hypothetical protein